MRKKPISKKHSSSIPSNKTNTTTYAREVDKIRPVSTTKYNTPSSAMSEMDQDRSTLGQKTTMDTVDLANAANIKTLMAKLTGDRSSRLTSS